MADLRALLALLALPCCTALSDFAIHQCESNAECDLADGVVRRCEQSRCVTGCADNHHCASMDPRRPICSSRGQACVGLGNETGECYLSSEYSDSSMGALTAREMIVLGAFAPTLKSSTWLTAQLAVSELNLQGGLPVVGGAEPVVLVLCDGTLEAIPNAMQHLVEDLGARAILASLEEQPLRAALTWGPAFFLNPSAVYFSPAQVESASQLLWYLSSDYEPIVGVYAELLRSLATARGADDVRLAFASGEVDAPSRGGDADPSLAAGVEAALRLDGVDAEELRRQDRLRKYDLRNDFFGADPLQSLVAYAPEVVVVFAAASQRGGPRSAALSTVEAIEAAALETAPERTPWRPIYVLGPRDAENGDLALMLESNPELATRVIGVRSYRADDELLSGSLASRFAQAYPASSNVPIGLAASTATYDAAYYLAYAVAAASHSGAARSADDVREGFARITDRAATPLDVGPAGLDLALQQLRARQPFLLRGTTGPADFDDAQRMRPSAGQVYCWSASGVVALADYDTNGSRLLVKDVSCGRSAL